MLDWTFICPRKLLSKYHLIVKRQYHQNCRVSILKLFLVLCTFLENLCCWNLMKYLSIVVFRSKCRIPTTRWWCLLHYFCSAFNPLPPYININILSTSLYTFPLVLTRRICSTIKLHGLVTISFTLMLIMNDSAV